MYLCRPFKKERAISSAGSEHLVYTEGVGGSNPSSPTTFLKKFIKNKFGSYQIKVVVLQSVSETKQGAKVLKKSPKKYFQNKFGLRVKKFVSLPSVQKRKGD